MRLTLRSLLAYLDDMLDPAQAKEIGDKITESEYASTLAERIREVMRRRRLSAPDLADKDPNININLISEYLDNTLSPEEVAKIERVCLESDLHLAEVAACHQILTMILGEPVNIESSTRERMYSLGPVESAIYQQSDTGSSVEIVPVTERSSDEAIPLGGSSHEFRLPPSEKEKVELPENIIPLPLWRRALAPLGLCAIAVIWVLFVYDDYFNPGGNETHISKDEEAKKEDQFEAKGDEDQLADAGDPAVDKKDGNEESQPDEKSEKTDGDKTKSEAPPAKVKIAKGEPKAEEKSVPVPPGTEKTDELAKVTPSDLDEKNPKPPVKDVKEAEKPENKKDKNNTEKMKKESDPEVPEKKIAEVDQEKAEKKSDSEQFPKSDINADPVSISYEEDRNILIRFEEKNGEEPAGWYVVKNEEYLVPGDRIAVPNPFRVDLDVETLGCHFALEQNFKGIILGPNEAAQTGIEISQGAVIVQKNPETGEGTYSFSLKIGTHLWKVDLLGETTVCGIDVRPRQPDSVTEELKGDLFNCTIYVTRGNVRIADGKSLLKVLEAGRHLRLSDNKDNSIESTRIVLNGFPGWITEPDELSPIQRRTGNLILKEFDRESNANENFVSLASHDHGRIATHAVETLELTANYPSLVELLSQSKSPKKHDMHIALINSIRNLMGANSKNGPLVEEEVHRKFHEDESDIVVRLLWGYQLADAEDPLISDQLVSYLGSSNIIIRELASYHVRRLTGRKFDYQPHASTSQRRTLLRRIQKHIDRYGALVPPKKSSGEPKKKEKQPEPEKEKIPDPPKATL
jgi:hypothetical protein